MPETIFWWVFTLACVFAFFFSYGMVAAPLSHSNHILKTIAKKQNTHRMTGPEAPRNLKPSTSNSIEPRVTSSTATRQNAEIADIPMPIVAAGCCWTIRRNQLSGEAFPNND